MVYMLERHRVEGRNADAIAKDLVGAFDRTAVQADRTTGTGVQPPPARVQWGRRDPGGGLIARLAFALVGLLAD